jgi:steroid delta-isomerase-like uncharacterized protein
MVGCQDKEAMAEIEEQNKELVRRYVEELNKGNIGLFNELCAPEYGYYSPSNSPKPLSKQEIFEFLEMVFRAFPDINWGIKELFAAGDRVITWYIVTGTNEGEFQGIPATRNKINISSFIMYRFKDGKIVEEREEYDALGFMQQLGMELVPKEGEK